MIPKIIHFCWFGGNPLPPLAIECIASWRKYLPDFEIWQWVENPSLPSFKRQEFATDKIMTFDVNSIPYTAEAYKQKKYAFVSDYARFWILNEYGGVYFDTDVEVIRSLNDILDEGAFMGFERDPDRWGDGYVAPGLGMAVEPHADIINELMTIYDGLHFLNEDGSPNTDKTIVHYTTEVLNGLGMKQVKGIQKLKNVTLYPSEFFAPINFVTRHLHVTEQTRTIHRYMGSWSEKKNKSIADCVKFYMPEIILLWVNRLKNYRNWKCFSQS